MSDTWYPNDVEVIVTYHTFPTKEEKKNTVNEKEKTNGKLEEVDTQEKKVVNSKLQKPKEKPKAHNDRSQSIFDKANGKMAIEIYNEFKDLGYTVDFKHEITKMDFTETVLYSSDPKDTEFYIPWIITDSVLLNNSSKIVTFLINTQEMVDEARKENDMLTKLEDKLSPSVAWGTVEMYGKKKHPNGFKLKLITGMLAETAIDENTWFLKSKCEIKNEYGKWIQGYTCESYVSGTTDSPKIVEFNIY